MSQKQNSNTYVVCSLKGGVGKTTLSYLLATLLHKKDRTVTIYHPDNFNVIAPADLFGHSAGSIRTV